MKVHLPLQARIHLSRAEEIIFHHGSKNSTSEAFLKILQPDIAVISCGKNNRFGHPHEDTLERVKKVGSKVVTTPESGTVSVRISEGKTTLTGYK